MMKKILLTVLLSFFMVGCLMGNSIATNNPYPDTSQYTESKLNVADLNDKLKYKLVVVITSNELIISYHVSIGDVYPKYVSLLWYGPVVVAFTYYDNGIFHSWIKYTSKDLLFNKIAFIRKIQQTFKLDFEFVWSDVEFVISQVS